MTLREPYRPLASDELSAGGGGAHYRLVPDRWEFWQGRKSRLHDRLRYSLVEGNWVRERLAP